MNMEIIRVLGICILYQCIHKSNQNPTAFINGDLTPLNNTLSDLPGTQLPSMMSTDTFSNESNPKPLPIVNSCFAFIEKFSNAAAEFTRCSIMFSRPLRFCENCINEYLQALQSYDAIVEGNSQDEAGAKCSDLVLGSDRIQIIRRTFKFIGDMWDKSHCGACFFGYNVNSTRSELNNDTLRFMELSNQTQVCFQNYTHGASIEPFVPHNQTISPLVCDSCRPVYEELNDFYHQLVATSHSGVCVDIVDMMNYTRLLWSKELLCTRHHVDIVPVVLLSIFFCSLPILFYVANKIHGTKAAKKLLKQKRLLESQLTSSVREDMSTGAVGT